MAAPPPLTEAVKKVDRAVARLEELQSSIIRSRNRNGNEKGLRHLQERPAVRQKVDVPVSRRSSLLAPAAKDAKCSLPEKQMHRRRSMPSNKNVPLGLANKRVPDIVEALSRSGLVSNKENVGAKKKRRKKSTLPGLVELSPSVAKGVAQRRVLESRPINVVATEQVFPSPLSSMSDVKSKEPKQMGSVCSSSDGRPPWKNATIVSTNNRHATTISERVRPSPATTGVHHVTTGVPTGTTGAGCSELPNRKSQHRVSLPASGRTSKSGATSARPSPAQDEIDFVKTFCVDVRPDPNRPWRLAPKMSNTYRPLVMFRNPAFRSYADQGTCEDLGFATRKLLQASPKLTPFKNFQMRPLKLSSLQQQPLFEPSPATIRPYLSPSKSSPRQSKPQEEEDPLAFLIGSKAPPEPSLCAFNTSRSSSLKKTMKESVLVPSQKESWLTKRLSFPSPSSRSFIKRFSLLHSSKTTDSKTYSPVKPLPSLITRLPTRTKPTSIDSLIVTPPLRLTKSLSNSTSATPLVSPLPLPPALRVLTSKMHNSPSQKLESSSHNGSSSSCHLHAEHSAHNKDQRDNSVYCSLSSRGLRAIVGSTRKKAFPSGFPGPNSSSVWPSMKQRSSSACQPHSLDCTSNCTGAGPYLFKHVKGWMCNSKTLTSQAQKGSSGGKR
ncbi:hypothetical protein GOP47_0005702 [Adiantum capillus-veneris]|uniref:Uncharacterized protein n=1 Tax=Adiantum capillus-veneris TaxID=13818 RepID=A0A9D4V6S9_ADICA|nr:hypothetical protein GOP47_0005702 [Adiantum capillus-veneris]